MNPSVCIVGNSVSLLVSPPRSNAGEKTYGEILEDGGVNVIHAGKQAAMVTDLSFYLEDEVIRHFPDHVILHFGIVECTRRAVGRRLQNFFSLNDWPNSVAGRRYNCGFSRLAKIILRKIYRRLAEIPLYALGISWHWCSPKLFRAAHLDAIQRIFRNTRVRHIQLIGITPLTDDLETRVPGTRASAKKYNAILREISLTVPDVSYIDVETAEFAGHTMDGIHFTPEGHRLLAEKIKVHLTRERNDFAGWSRIRPFPAEEKLRDWAAGR